MRASLAVCMFCGVYVTDSFSFRFCSPLVSSLVWYLEMSNYQHHSRKTCIKILFEMEKTCTFQVSAHAVPYFHMYVCGFSLDDHRTKIKLFANEKQQKRDREKKSYETEKNSYKNLNIYWANQCCIASGYECGFCYFLTDDANQPTEYQDSHKFSWHNRFFSSHWYRIVFLFKSNKRNFDRPEWYGKAEMRVETTDTFCYWYSN